MFSGLNEETDKGEGWDKYKLIGGRPVKCPFGNWWIGVFEWLR